MSIFKLYTKDKLKNPENTAEELNMLQQFSGNGIFITIIEKIMDNDHKHSTYDAWQHGRHRSSLMR